MKIESAMILRSIIEFVNSCTECAAGLVDVAKNESEMLYYKGKADAFEIVKSWVVAYRDALEGIESNDRP